MSDHDYGYKCGHGVSDCDHGVNGRGESGRGVSDRDVNGHGENESDRGENGHGENESDRDENDCDYAVNDCDVHCHDYENVSDRVHESGYSLNDHDDASHGSKINQLS